MIDHFGIKVKDLEASKLFYQQALEPLGYKLAFEIPQAVSFAEPQTAPAGDFWLSQGQSDSSHFAFCAEAREQVDAFYQAGLAAGGQDNGAPGIRPQYHQPYYAAFVLDPDGNNVEAVCHKE
ncbi:VOC family protein [Streptococcus gordonii]|uniref:VOC family protein n=1 Tax=Streptococcus gordonii TaxID=1302 RepID=UPI001EDECBC3|nr:VOC family protein [Streptococcus gordonii]MCG4822189.1 VOC family protein [Streptococcus gordonii]MCG4847799.1 VOC family protein [Streptococcus gordonii]MDE8686118.1 VOC family protein [Streptococcus gordonii]